MLNERSVKALTGVNEKLVRVVKRADEISPLSFIVTEGLRSRERQALLVAQGASKTLNSMHIVGRAVDVAPVVANEVRWDWPLFHKLAESFKQAAKELEIEIVWGGDWKMKDGPHFELGSKE